MRSPCQVGHNWWQIAEHVMATAEIADAGGFRDADGRNFRLLMLTDTQLMLTRSRESSELRDNPSSGPTTQIPSFVGSRQVLSPFSKTSPLKNSLHGSIPASATTTPLRTKKATGDLVKATKIILVTAIAIFSLLAPTASQAGDGSSWSGRFRRPKTVEVFFRGQSPADGGVPVPSGANGVIQGDGTGSGAFPGQVYPGNPAAGYGTGYPGTTTWNAFSPPVMPDPFLGQPGMGVPGLAPSPYAPYSPYQAQGVAPGQTPGGFAYGANGARPYRFGWTNRIDVSYLSKEKINSPPGGAAGKMGVFGVDYDLAYSSPYVPGWIVNWTNQFSYRNWSGPDGSIGLPSDVFRFGIDLEFETPKAGPYSVSLGVTPSLNTDFNGDVWNKGFMVDGRGILFMQLDQFWTLGLGAMYWNRVDDLVVPYAGFIYRDDYWEWQIMWPEARVSLFLGNEAYWSKWLYARGEYHVEAYGVERRAGTTVAKDRVQLRDYRILIGTKMETGYSSWFFEGGWVFDRNVKFDSKTPGYDVVSGFIGQIGLRY
jgi:hypothetical protein